MKGFRLPHALACAMAFLPATLASASAPAPAPRIQEMHRSPVRHENEIRFEKVRPDRSAGEISLGDIVVAPTTDTSAATPSEPEIIVAPVYVPVAGEPVAAPSRGPRIIYIGKETERQRTGFMPRVIYGDMPARAASGPEILYGDSGR